MAGQLTFLMSNFGGPIPDPVVISPKIQEFWGERYWLHGKYYVRQLKGRPTKVLHREVWRSRHGNIPRGWQVHHRNENRDDNSFDNLLAQAPQDHVRHHVGVQRDREDRRERVRRNFDVGRRKPRPQAQFVCTMCRKEYMARPSRGLRKNSCCSMACHNRAYRLRKKEALNAA
jgi:hypothetical protein